MTNFLKMTLGLILGFVLSVDALAATKLAEPEPGQISIYIGQLLERGHLTRQPLDNEVSNRLLRSHLESLDYSRMFFTQKDIDGIESRYLTELDDYILLGNPKPAYEIQALFRKRVTERVAYVKQLLKKDYKFNTNKVIELDRKKAPWPADTAEADGLWQDRIEGELLQATLNEHATRPPRETVLRRYNQLLRNVNDLTDNDVVYDFLAALSRVYDPHSEYMSPDDLENFEISMRLSLVGIGALLRADEGYTRIVSLVPGGPADIQGQLKVNDRITGVAEGQADFEDVIDLKLDNVVKMIRGKKNTTVRLMVIPSNASDPSEQKVIEIVRDEVELKDSEASAEVIERHGTDGTLQRFGWITLPSFYADMGRSFAKDAKSTTKDVAILLERLRKENIAGLVIDLRRNGGGSLEEAVNLTGLFIKSGPVVQTKDTNGDISISRDRDSRIAYDGPMVVLTSRLSASASEIFAGALQDYNRAVIVGDQSTFGKGTVQTMLQLGRMLPRVGGESQKAGALKLTIQQFYRPSGQSTQLRGVLSDIVLPSISDQPDIGEGALKNPLPYDEVESLSLKKFADNPLFISELRRRSDARVATSREFGYVMDEIKRINKQIADNTISLNERARRNEIAARKSRSERRKAERASAKPVKPVVYEITLDNVDNPDLILASSEPKEKTPKLDADFNEIEEDEEDFFDARREESLNILADLATLSSPSRTAKVNKIPAIAN